MGGWEKEILREGGGKDGKSFLECTQYRSPFSLSPLSGGGGGERGVPPERRERKREREHGGYVS